MKKFATGTLLTALAALVMDFLITTICLMVIYTCFNIPMGVAQAAGTWVVIFLVRYIFGTSFHK